MTQAEMTAEQFAAIQPNLGRFTLDTVQIARRVMVDGESQTSIAESLGMSRQRINGMVNRVRAAANEVPAGWVRVETWLPPALAAEVERMAAEAKAQQEQKDTQNA